MTAVDLDAVRAEALAGDVLAPVALKQYGIEFEALPFLAWPLSVTGLMRDGSFDLALERVVTTPGAVGALLDTGFDMGDMQRLVAQLQPVGGRSAPLARSSG